MTRISGAMNRIRGLGLRATLALVIVKAKSVLELLYPVTIQGERIRLQSVKKPLTDVEVDQVYSWSFDDDILRWSGGSRSQMSLTEFRAQIHRERWHPQFNQRLLYIATKNDEIIGRLGLYTIDWTKREGEFGISVDKRFWNKKYGREATNLLIQYIFTRTPIQRIYLGTFHDNLRAQHSFAASGFRKTGTITRFIPSEGIYVDGVEMEITLADIKK